MIFNTPIFNIISLQKILYTQYEYWLLHFPTAKDLKRPLSLARPSLLTCQLHLYNKFYINFLLHSNILIQWF